MQRLTRLNFVLVLGITIMLVLASVSCNSKSKPTVAEAETFIADTETLLADLSVKAGRAQWVQANFITDDTEAIASQANEDFISATTRLAADVKQFDGMQFPPALERKFKLLKLSLFSLGDPKEREEVAKLGTSMEAAYGKGKACPETREARRHVPPHRRSGTGAGDEPGSRGDEGSVGGVARRGGAAAPEIHALHRAAE